MSHLAVSEDSIIKSSIPCLTSVWLLIYAVFVQSNHLFKEYRITSTIGGVGCVGCYWQLNSCFQYNNSRKLETKKKYNCPYFFIHSLSLHSHILSSLLTFIHEEEAVQWKRARTDNRKRARTPSNASFLEVERLRQFCALERHQKGLGGRCLDRRHYRTNERFGWSRSRRQGRYNYKPDDLLHDKARQHRRSNGSRRENRRRSHRLNEIIDQPQQVRFIQIMSPVCWNIVEPICLFPPSSLGTPNSFMSRTTHTEKVWMQSHLIVQLIRCTRCFHDQRWHPDVDIHTVYTSDITSDLILVDSSSHHHHQGIHDQWCHPDIPAVYTCDPISVNVSHRLIVFARIVWDAMLSRIGWFVCVRE